MKVSAPVPPIPEPPPAAVDAGASANSEVSTADQPAAPPVKMATWPDWFKPVDLALAILVIALAFLLASFTARNADLWRHLGTGRLILQGNHPIGGDPLSYTGADRAWVNSNWIFDALMYATYSADDTGVTSVVLKACVFAAAFAVLFLLRRPEQSLWPWAVAAALGVIATGSLASLRPYVFGMLLLSIVLAVIYRADWTGPKWRMPAILGGICLLWSCTDSFYFVGPLTILLIWGGERLHRKFTAGQPEQDPTDDPFWAPPPDDALLRALLMSVAGVLLNPMFVGAFVRNPADAVSQLVPFELTFGWADVFAGDTQLSVITHSPLSPAYYEGADRGDNVTGYTALALVVGSGLLLGAGLSRLRATHVLLWFAFVVLGLLHYRFIPVAALMAIPLAAGHLNGLSRFRLQGVFDPRTKMILNLSGVGRIVSVTVVILLIGLTVPGYLHAKLSLRPEFNRRVSWGVEEDVGLARGAKLLQEWKTTDKMSEESHGMLAHYDFGDYCAWYAPREKVFIDSRFRFHGPELIDLIAIRSELFGRPNADGSMPTETGSLKRLADKHRADYIVLGVLQTRLSYQEIIRVEIGFTDEAGPGSTWLHMDGRIAIATRTDTATGKTNAANLIYTPGQGAFAPGFEAVPSAASIPYRQPVDSWIADFIDVPKPGSVATDDALLFAGMADYFGGQTQQQWYNLAQFHRLFAGVIGAASAQRLNPGERTPTEPELAFPLMASRAAWRAIVETPDDPEPYWALAQAYSLPYTGNLGVREKSLGRMTSLRRFLDRVPASPKGGERFSRKVIEAEFELFLLHYEAGQLDLALEALSRANAKIKTAPERDLPQPGAVRAWGNAYRQKSLEQMFGQQFGLPPGSLDGALQYGDSTIANAVMNFIARQIEMAGARKPTADEGMKIYRSVAAEITASNLDATDKSDKTKPPDAAWVKARSQALEDRVKREIAKRNEAFAAETKSVGLAQKFVASIRYGFFGRATDLIFVEPDWASVPASGFELHVPRDYAPQFRERFSVLVFTSSRQQMPDGSMIFRTSDVGLNLQAIALLFESGSLDKAAQQLKHVTEIVEKEDPDKPAATKVASAQAAIKLLQGLQARLEGNTTAMAEDKREQLQRQPKLPPAILEQLVVSFADLQAAAGAMGGGTLSWVDLDPLMGYRNQLRTEASLYYDLGLTALLAGDNKEARIRFAMALKPQGLPVKFIGFADEEPLVMYSTRYLEVLDKYAGVKRGQ